MSTNTKGISWDCSLRLPFLQSQIFFFNMTGPALKFPIDLVEMQDGLKMDIELENNDTLVL